MATQMDASHIWLPVVDCYQGLPQTPRLLSPSRKQLTNHPPPSGKTEQFPQIETPRAVRRGYQNQSSLTPHFHRVSYQTGQAENSSKTLRARQASYYGQGRYGTGFCRYWLVLGKVSIWPHWLEEICPECGASMASVQIELTYCPTSNQNHVRVHKEGVHPTSLAFIYPQLKW